MNSYGPQTRNLLCIGGMLIFQMKWVFVLGDETQKDQVKYLVQLS